jgi:hypothetical protein
MCASRPAGMDGKHPRRTGRERSRDWKIRWPSRILAGFRRSSRATLGDHDSNRDNSGPRRSRGQEVCPAARRGSGPGRRCPARGLLRGGRDSGPAAHHRPPGLLLPGADPCRLLPARPTYPDWFGPPGQVLSGHPRTPAQIIGELLTGHPEAASLLAKASHRRALARSSTAKPVTQPAEPWAGPVRRLVPRECPASVRNHLRSSTQ